VFYAAVARNVGVVAMICGGTLYKPTTPTSTVTTQLPVIMTAWHTLKQNVP
jgi:hypothetical protein